MLGAQLQYSKEKQQRQRQAQNRAVTYETSTWLEGEKQQVFTGFIFLWGIFSPWVLFLNGFSLQDIFPDAFLGQHISGSFSPRHV